MFIKFHCKDGAHGYDFAGIINMADVKMVTTIKTKDSPNVGRSLISYRDGEQCVVTAALSAIEGALASKATYADLSKVKETTITEWTA